MAPQKGNKFPGRLSAVTAPAAGHGPLKGGSKTAATGWFVR